MRYFPFDRPGTFYKGNIHSHSTRSDGLLSPADVACAYREQGYDFIAITDHFLERYGSRITDTSHLRTVDFTTIPGAELHARALENGILWDLVALGLPADFAPIGATESAAELAARASATGAFVAIAHPAWNGVTHSDALSIIDSIDAIEIHNEGHTLDSDRGNGWMLADSLATAGHRLSTFAADDAHFKSDRFDRFGAGCISAPNRLIRRRCSPRSRPVTTIPAPARASTTSASRQARSSSNAIPPSGSCSAGAARSAPSFRATA